MEENQNNAGGLEDNNTQQNNTENMYSYRDNSQNIQESGAIRRSMGDVNPSNVNYFTNKFGSKNNYNNNNIGQFDNSERSSENTQNNNNLSWLPFIILFLFEGIIILCLALLFEKEFDPPKIQGDIFNCSSTFIEEEKKFFNYGQLRDLNIMAFIGFGFLHTILKKNSWTSISVNTLIMVVSIQIALFSNFVWDMGFNENWKTKTMDFQYINEAIFISCSASITFGCILGKLSIIQYLIMAIAESILVTMNFQFGEEKLETVDTGGALYVHTFGAVFALSISVVLFCSSKAKEQIQRYENLNRSNYFSNITTFLGLLLIFAFFPNFNSVLSYKQMNVNRSRINTYLSLIGSVIGSLVTSGIINQGKVVLEQILYGTLSGGIIISGCCSVCLYHWASLILGTASGAIAVVLLAKIKPFFIGWGLRDCCNVIMIHGIFGILGGFITPMFVGGLNKTKIQDNEFFHDNSRSPARQAVIQVGGLFITLGISFVGGIATGFLMKVSTCNELNILFTDAELFKDFNDDTNIKMQIDDDKGSQPSYN